MQIKYGFSQYLKKLGITVRRPQSFAAQNVVAITVNVGGSVEVLNGEGSDFLVESIVIDSNFDSTFTDTFVGMETVKEGYKHYNRRGSFLNATAVQNCPFVPYIFSRSQLSPLVLPWIIKSNDILRFNVFSPFGSIQIGDFRVVVNGYMLDSVGQETPFIPHSWTMGDNDNMSSGETGTIDSIVITGQGDFVCTNISDMSDHQLNEFVLQNVRVENAQEGGRMLTDRQTWGTGSFIRNFADGSEAALPVPWDILNNSVITRVYDNDRTPAGTVRRPQLSFFGFYVNPKVSALAGYVE